MLNQQGRHIQNMAFGSADFGSGLRSSRTSDTAIPASFKRFCVATISSVFSASPHKRSSSAFSWPALPRSWNLCGRKAACHPNRAHAVPAPNGCPAGHRKTFAASALLVCTTTWSTAVTRPSFNQPWAGLTNHHAGYRKKKYRATPPYPNAWSAMCG